MPVLLWATLGFIWQGVVLMTIWNWSIVDILPIPSITFAEALLLMLARCALGISPPDFDAHLPNMEPVIKSQVIYPTVVLALVFAVEFIRYHL